MSLREQRAVVLRLVTNEPYRLRFFSAPLDHHAEFGLTRDEFDALRRLDPHRVAVAGGGNVLKRFDIISPAFPYTLAFLEPRVQDLRQRYAAAALLASNESRELDTFHEFVIALPLPADERPLLAAIAGLERQARALSPAVASDVRIRDALAPRPSPSALVVRVDLDLADALDAIAAGRAPILTRRPQQLVTWIAAGRLRWNALDPQERALLAACDGATTVAQLRANHGVATEATLSRWAATGLLAFG